MAETILVVDDDLDILELLKMNLEPEGYKVRTASDGDSAVQSAGTDPPDLILLDVMMPHKDGFQVIEELKNIEETKNVPVILVTARGQTEDKVRGLDTGADDYITKPFDLREVTARVEAVLGRTRPIKYINPLMRAMGEGFSEEGLEQLAGHLQAAAAIQKKLLPEKAPNLDGFDIATLLQSSTSVSGDFYDFIPLSETQIGIVLGDVKGSGIPAALLMVMIRTALRLLCHEEDTPAAILKRINDLVARDTEADLFATMIYGILDTATSTFTYANGGHCYPLHWNNARSIDVLKTGSMLIGAFEEATFTTSTCLLEPNDVLVFYTDGITETAAGDAPVSDGNHSEPTNSEQDDMCQDAILTDTFYGGDRLAACLSKNAALSASALCEAIVNDLAHFSGSTQTHDDRALIVIKRDV
ncbi:SpoIIE family protein phosphatase [Candidatus Poribacteria bacterium]|nr:SpoIIE family protein phosphatase [Candidatus Poribacteria bacterium]MYA99082.1 SpoIIE family protein phosphatase [Candidatus Poribacteria bacterium]